MHVHVATVELCNPRLGALDEGVSPGVERKSLNCILTLIINGLCCKPKGILDAPHALSA